MFYFGKSASRQNLAILTVVSSLFFLQKSKKVVKNLFFCRKERIVLFTYLKNYIKIGLIAVTLKNYSREG